MDNPFGDLLAHPTNGHFELHDCTDEANFDQFIDLIRGENEVTGFDCDLINGLLADNDQSAILKPVGIFDFDHATTFTSSTTTIGQPDPNYVPIALPRFGDQDMIRGIEETNDFEESSGTTTKTAERKTKTDRSRTLVSERCRRGRMKEKLYALRSLVPNITKMDKASIIGDAVLYVQQLQMQVKKLKTDIAGLEACLIGPERHQGSNRNWTYPKKAQMASSSRPTHKKIIKMDVFQLEERGFYVRLVCTNGEGIAISLFRVLESLASFDVQNSNLVTVSDEFILTFTLNVKESEQDMYLPNLKLWVSGALLNQGFEVSTA